jgi:hypothetical protein
LSFPEYFSDQLEFLNHYREYILLKAENASGEDKSEELQKAQEQLMQKPAVFDPFDDSNVPKMNEEQLGEMLAIMEDNGASAEGMTEYNFYLRMKYLSRKFKAQAGE